MHRRGTQATDPRIADLHAKLADVTDLLAGEVRKLGGDTVAHSAVDLDSLSVRAAALGKISGEMFGPPRGRSAEEGAKRPLLADGTHRTAGTFTDLDDLAAGERRAEPARKSSWCCFPGFKYTQAYPDSTFRQICGKQGGWISNGLDLSFVRIRIIV